MPLLGSVTTATPTPIFLRCTALTESAHVYRPEMIATEVGSLTPSNNGSAVALGDDGVDRQLRF